GRPTDNKQLQDIADVAPDGMPAKGRFRAFMQGGSHVSRPDRNERLPLQWWEAGVYENDYVKEGGVWKIRTLDYHMFWQADYEKGWAHSEPYVGSFFQQTFPDDPDGPDELTERRAAFWPETPVVPYHYAHPVTGEAWHGSLAHGVKEDWAAQAPRPARCSALFRPDRRAPAAAPTGRLGGLPASAGQPTPL